jgi:hypothetical protein
MTTIPLLISVVSLLLSVTVFYLRYETMAHHRSPKEVFRTISQCEGLRLLLVGVGFGQFANYNLIDEIVD